MGISWQVEMILYVPFKAGHKVFKLFGFFVFLNDMFGT